MSSIKVEVVEIRDVRPHPNADALDIATVNGWQVVVKKGQFQTGDGVVYFESGTVIPMALAEELGIVTYLSHKLDIDGIRQPVIHRVKLRGEPSFGLVVPVGDASWQVGDIVTDFYGATKYQPPMKVQVADAMEDHPMFFAYTDIEHLRSYPDVLVPGEPVVATEKLHGMNVRAGFVREGDRLILMGGSRSLRRKPPFDPESQDTAWRAKCAENVYWHPWSHDSVYTLMAALIGAGYQQAILYGEVIGRGIQSYDYGQRGYSFRAFDLMIDGQYLDYTAFVGWCERFGVPMVPLLYRGPFDLTAIQARADGESLVGGLHGREGVVVRPVVERHDYRVGRVVLKWIGDQYLFGKAGAQDTTDV